MNFLLHRHIAIADGGGELAGIGAMLPDLWRMADRRVRPVHPPELAWQTFRARADRSTEAAWVLRGIEHHLEVDLWFHEHEVFVTGERATAAALRAARTEAKKLPLFAHPLWEMCLDGALVRELGAGAVRSAVARGFERAREAMEIALDVHHLTHAQDGRDYRDDLVARMRWLTDELSNGPWIEGYSRPDGLVRGLAGMRRRFALPPFGDHERARLIDAIADLAPLADATLARIHRIAAARAHPAGEPARLTVEGSDDA